MKICFLGSLEHTTATFEVRKSRYDIVNKAFIIQESKIASEFALRVIMRHYNLGIGMQNTISCFLRSPGSVLFSPSGKHKFCPSAALVAHFSAVLALYFSLHQASLASLARCDLSFLL